MVEEESNEGEVLTQEPLQQSEPIAIRSQRRVFQKLAHFTEMVAFALPVCDDNVPSTYPKAI